MFVLKKTLEIDQTKNGKHHEKKWKSNCKSNIFKDNNENLKTLEKYLKTYSKKEYEKL